jgi:signal transduction histidine kinase
VADQVMPFVRSRQLRLRTAIDGDLGTFEVDADKVRDAVTNLLTNAIKFTPDGGEIALEARLAPGPGDEAEIQVADRGIGIDPRSLGQLFEPFFTQFDPSNHSTGDFGFKKRGIGLGLTIVKKFVELHGGRVWAASAPGEGTRVTIRLPRRPRPAPGLQARGADDASAAPADGGRRG